jgi:DNA polymerase III subunit delta
VKLDARRVEAFLRDPGTTRAVLLHGDDVGLIGERAARLVRGVAGSLGDPFRVVELDRDGWKRLPEEMAALALTGGRRVVRLRDGSDALVPMLQAALAGPGAALAVIEAPGLASRSKLRGLVEDAAEAASIACYRLDEAALEREMRAGLQERGVAVDGAAAAWLAAQLGSDLAGTRGEIEKLALYAGRGGTIDLAAAQACVGDQAGLSLEDALYAATAGDVGAADRALELALAEGGAAVGVLRAALGHIQRLHRARLEMAGGRSAAEAAKSVRPPLFFRRVPAFEAALRLWSPADLAEASAALWRAERACKRTGAPADAICRNAVTALGLRAARRRAA